MSGRRISLELKPELSRFMQQERSRLKTQYGLNVTNHDIIRTLLEQHRLRVMNAAEEDKAMLWYYQKLEDLERDTATAAARAAETAPDAPRRRPPGRPPKKW